MMYSNVELITPDIAEAYLARNKANRKLKPRAIKNYARDMKNGKWQLNPDGISFYEDGTLANGQNRLTAVIKSQTPTEFYVTRNVPLDAFIFDRGVSRSTVDVLNMKQSASTIATTNAVTMVNYLFDLCCNSKVSEDIIIDFMVNNEELIHKAVMISGLGGSAKTCRQTPVVAAIFCSLYCGVSDETMKEFCTVANSGFSTSDEQTAAIVLRRFIADNYAVKNWVHRKNAFTVACCAIRDFSYKKPRRITYKFDAKCPYFDVVNKEILSPYIRSYVGGEVNAKAN